LLNYANRRMVRGAASCSKCQRTYRQRGSQLLCDAWGERRWGSQLPRRAEPVGREAGSGRVGAAGGQNGRPGFACGRERRGAAPAPCAHRLCCRAAKKTLTKKPDVDLFKTEQPPRRRGTDGAGAGLGHKSPNNPGRHGSPGAGHRVGLLDPGDPPGGGVSPRSRLVGPRRDICGGYPFCRVQRVIRGGTVAL